MPLTALRQNVIKTMESYRDILLPENKNWLCLEVGIDGDERPSGNYKYFGKGNVWRTLDNVAHLKPDIVADICDTQLNPNQFDLIIISQTLEHVYDFTKALLECERILKPGGHLIVDCPWNYPFHGTQDYGDYWRISHQALRKQLQGAGLRVISCQIYNDLVTSALATK